MNQEQKARITFEVPKLTKQKLKIKAIKEGIFEKDLMIKALNQYLGLVS